MKNRIAFTALALLALLPASLPGCPCDEDVDSDLCDLLEDLTDLAFGQDPLYKSRPDNCIEGLVCRPPYCIWAEENGSFENGTWPGDTTREGSFECRGARSLEFLATTPEGPSDSPSSQVYQVVDYNALVPEAERASMRRVRVQGVFDIFIPTFSSDLQFGLRIDAYAGDAAAFPREGDPETFAAQTDAYSRLESTEATLLYDTSGYDPEGNNWQPLRAELMLPDGTDFFVVLVEAYENVENDVTSDEFRIGSFVDLVQIAIDGGPSAPVLAPNHADTFEDRTVRILVLSNDYDLDGKLLPETVEVVEGQAPMHGTTVVDRDGSILYTPEAGYSGPDAFRYAVSDDDGFTASALVTVDVRRGNRPPVAKQDEVATPQNTAIVIDVLANDTDPDGDSLTVSFVGPALLGTTEIINNGQAVRYAPYPDSSGADAFGYLAADDKGATSFEALVLVDVVADTNNPPVVTDAIDDFSVNVDPRGECSFDLDDHFADPDGDVLFYGFTVSSNAVTVTINGSTITVRGAIFGQATVTVIAQDTGGLRASDAFEVDAALATDCGGNRAEE